MKHLLSTLLFFCLALSLMTACGAQRAPNVPAATPEPVAPLDPAPPSEAEQRALLEQHRALWGFTDYWDSPWFYTFTDLDRNGRLEVIAATTQGSGMYTYGRFYEITPDFAGVRNCCHESLAVEGPDDWPEIVMESLPCWYDSAADRYYYAVEGITRDGFRHQYLAWYALCLYDGVADWEFIASKDVEYREDGSESVECRDAQGGMISEQDYDSTLERRFAGMVRSELKLGWEMVEIPMPEEPQPLFDGAAEGAGSLPVTITKNPSSEALSVGGKTWFIAHAENADCLTWELVDPNGQVYDLSAALSAHPGLSLEVLPEDTIAVSNVPLSLNGWGVRARFSGAGSEAVTEPAYVYVGDFVSAYEPVLAAYRAAYASGQNGNAAYMFEHMLSEMTAYSSGVGYALKDLDKNGVPELLIFGSGTLDDFARDILYDCYTLVNGVPVQLACSQTRSRYSVRTDSSLYQYGSGGASYAINALYRVNGAALAQQELAFSYPESGGSLGWYSLQGEGEASPGGASVPISEQEYTRRVSAMKAALYTPPLTTLY